MSPLPQKIVAGLTTKSDKIRALDASGILPTKALAASMALTFAVPAAAQTADPAMSTAPAEDNDDDFPWGLLGLLGLAGLMGLKKRDDDVRVDRTANTNRKM